jgi:hypothetical protein
MTRQEILSRLEPILTRVNSAADDLSSLMTSPEFDEDYKVARAGQLSTENFDRLHLAAVELSIATESLLRHLPLPEAVLHLRNVQQVQEVTMATDQSHQCYIDRNTLRHSACNTALTMDGNGRPRSVICPKCKVEVDPNDRFPRAERYREERKP